MTPLPSFGRAPAAAGFIVPGTPGAYHLFCGKGRIPRSRSGFAAPSAPRFPTIFLPTRRMARRAVLLGSLLLLSLWPGRAIAQFTTAQQPTMPSVVGLTEAQARSRLQQFQMSIEVTRVASAQPEGTV